MVVALSGEIDIVTAPAARDLLAEAASAAVTGVTVDLGGVTFLDAAGLGVLAGAAGAVRHLPDGFRLVAVPARVLRLLKLTGLDRHLAAFPAPPRSQQSLLRVPESRSTTAGGGEVARAVVEGGLPV